MTPQLAEILRTGHVRSVDGQRSIPLDSAITPDVGEFLRDVIRQRKPTSTLEVGLAYGISGLFICEALRECGATRHIAIGPNQSTQWEGIGFNNLVQAGFRDLLELHESPSHLALPNLEASGTRIEFAFIDGWHTFDHPLTDFSHIDRMLAVGGILVFDDVLLPGVHQACRYVALNRAYSVKACTERVADYRPSNIDRILRGAASYSTAARKLPKSRIRDSR